LKKAAGQKQNGIYHDCRCSCSAVHRSPCSADGMV
jgi:hypothetical protein